MDDFCDPAELSEVSHDHQEASVPISSLQPVESPVSMDDFCDPAELSEVSHDHQQEAAGARQSKGFKAMFHELRTDPHAFIRRARNSLSPQLQESLQRTSSEVIDWMQKGSPWRAVLVSSVGVVLLLGLAGLGTFMLFLLAATLNAVAIGLLVSIASVGAFVGLFFAMLMAIYIGALVVAFLAISTITFFCICATFTAAGCVAFLWIVWHGLEKGVHLVKSFFIVSGRDDTWTVSNGETDKQREKVE